MCRCPFTNEGLIAACAFGASDSTDGNGTTAPDRNPCWPCDHDAASNDYNDNRQHQQGALWAGVDGHQHQHRQHQIPGGEDNHITAIDDTNTNSNGGSDNGNSSGRNEDDKTDTRRQEEEKEEEKEDGDVVGKTFVDTGGEAPSLLPLVPSTLPPQSIAGDGDDETTDQADATDAGDKPAAPGDDDQERRPGQSRGGRDGEGHGRAAGGGGGGAGGRQGIRTEGRGAGGFGAHEGGLETGEGTAAVAAAAATAAAAKRPCARAPSSPPLPPLHPSAPSLAHRAPQQQLTKVSLAWCHGVRGSGVIALMQSGRLGRHTRAFDVTGLRSLEDRHVDVLLAGLPLLQVLFERISLTHDELILRARFG